MTAGFRICEKCKSQLAPAEDACPRCLLAAVIEGPSTETLRMDANYAPQHQVAGRYSIVRLLGSGGMGTVYEALDSTNGTSVALKVMRSEQNTSEAAERFERECEILAKLDHPNIAHFLDAGTTAEGLPFLAMEYVDGLPIDDHCDQRMLGIDERMLVFQSLCSAVHYLHLQGVVHRDLKPSNILVAKDGAVKLLDFGIAKHAHPVLQGITRSGLRLMTPEYASPEQVRAEPITPLSDVYSLGVVLYELLTGRRPYRLQSRILHEIMRAICEEAPEAPSLAVTRTETHPGGVVITPEGVSHLRKTSPEKLRAKLAGQMDAILLKAMSKDPRDRYWSADQFASDLRSHLDKAPLLAQIRSGWSSSFATFLREKVYVLLICLAAILLVATGSVNRTGLGIIALAAVLMTVWKIGTHPVLGRQIAESSFVGGFSSYGVWLFALIVLDLPSNARGYLDGERAALNGAGASTAVSSMEESIIAVAKWTDLMYYFVFALALVAIAVCIQRLKFAGSRLKVIELFHRRRPTVILFSLPFILGITQAPFSTGTFWELALPILATPMGLVFLIWTWRNFGKLEFRERAVVLHGSMYGWSDIQSFSWEPSIWDTDFKVLRLDVRRHFGFLPPVRVELRHSQVEEAEGILRAMLSPWPEGSVTRLKLSGNGDRVLSKP